MLQDLKRDVINGKRALSDAITTALPLFRNKIPEQKVAYLVNEYQGYQSDALDFYKRRTKDYPAYRIVDGQMKMMMSATGELTDIKHPLASQPQLFISAPIAWVEESSHLGIDPTMVEMGELGKLPNGLIVCVTSLSSVQRIVEVVKQSLLSFIDEAELAQPN
jgi:hypothetical protein